MLHKIKTENTALFLRSVYRTIIHIYARRNRSSSFMLIRFSDQKIKHRQTAVSRTAAGSLLLEHLFCKCLAVNRKLQ